MTHVLGESPNFSYLPITLRVVQREVIGVEGLDKGKVVHVDDDMLAIDLGEEQK